MTGRHTCCSRGRRKHRHRLPNLARGARRRPTGADAATCCPRRAASRLRLVLPRRSLSVSRSGRGRSSRCSRGTTSAVLRCRSSTSTAGRSSAGAHSAGCGFCQRRRRHGRSRGSGRADLAGALGRHRRRRLLRLDGRRRGRRLRRRRGFRRCDRRTRRQQRQRVDVPLGIAGDPHAEVDVRLCVFRRPARADQPEGRALGDGCAAANTDRSEVEERDRVAVDRPDGDGEPASGNGARERDRPGGRRADGGASAPADVDSAMVPGGIWVVAEAKRL